MSNVITRLAVAGIAGGAIVCAGGGAAFAAQGTPAPLPAAELNAATAAAADASGLDLAQRVAAHTDADGDRTARTLTTSDEPRIVGGTTTAVYGLSPDFVRSGRGPVGRLTYVANTAKVDGTLVTIMSAKDHDGSGWRAFNAASGDLEARLARQAQGGSLFREPQINGWYALRGDRIVGLNADARAVVGNGMSLNAYQRLVHSKYASMLPGSAYSKAGMAGGFGSPAQAAAPAAAPAAPAAAAPAAAPAPAQDASAPTVVLAGAGGAGLLAAAGVVAARRRRSRG